MSSAHTEIQSLPHPDVSPIILFSYSIIRRKRCFHYHFAESFFFSLVLSSLAQALEENHSLPLLSDIHVKSLNIRTSTTATSLLVLEVLLDDARMNHVDDDHNEEHKKSVKDVQPVLMTKKAPAKEN